MYKQILLLVLLLCSCTKDEPTDNPHVDITKTDIGSSYSIFLASPLPDKKYVENQKTQSIYNSIIKGIRPDMSNDSVKKVLQSIHYWDQVYRDSLHTKNTSTWVKDETKTNKYWEQISMLDIMNQRIVLHLLNTIGGWPDTRDMGHEATMAIYLVIRHTDENKEFAKQILPFLNKAYYSDSIISNQMYASTFDGVQSTLGSDSKYGTFPFNKKYHSDSAVNHINVARNAIGLDKL